MRSDEEESDGRQWPATPQERAVYRNNGEYWRWCPRCGHELRNEKCKFRCPRCGYFLSCSDFD